LDNRRCNFTEEEKRHLKREVETLASSPSAYAYIYFWSLGNQEDCEDFDVAL